MNIYQKVSTLLALCLYVPLGLQILSGKVTQNIATWILWGTFDALAAGSMFLQHGNWYLPGAYVFGVIFILTCMIRARSLTWTWFETLVSLVVLICVVGWALSGPWLATILSTAGGMLAAAPQLKDAWKAPKEMPLSNYLGYMIANALACAGGSAWTVEERLFPAACTVLCGVISLVCCRRFLNTER